jgi:hypothetical protein
MKRRIFILSGGLAIGFICGLYVALLQVAVIQHTNLIGLRPPITIDVSAFPFNLLQFDDAFVKLATFGLLLQLPVAPALYAMLVKFIWKNSKTQS